MLGVDRIYSRFGFGQQSGDVFASHDECLFVCESYVFAGFDRRDSGCKSAVTDSGGHDHIDIVAADRLTEGVISCGNADAEWFEGLAQTVVFGHVGDHSDSRTVTARKFDEIIDAAACRYYRCFVEIRPGIDYFKCLCADGACSSYNSNIFRGFHHSFPYFNYKIS